MATQKEVKNRIASVRNIHKITRAMEMVAAARLRRAEQRIDAMRPYAQAIRKMTRQVAEAAEGVSTRLPLLQQRDLKRVTIALVTGDRGLAGGFNTQIVREGIRLRNVIGHNESLTSPYHRERVARFRGQTHGDMRRATMRRYRRML